MRVIKGALNYLSRSCRRNCCLVTLEATCAEGALHKRRKHRATRTRRFWWRKTSVPPPLRSPKYLLRTSNKREQRHLSSSGKGKGREPLARWQGGGGDPDRGGGRWKKLYLCERTWIDRRAMRVSTKFRANKSVSKAGEEKK